MSIHHELHILAPGRNECGPWKLGVPSPFPEAQLRWDYNHDSFSLTWDTTSAPLEFDSCTIKVGEAEKKDKYCVFSFGQGTFPPFPGKGECRLKSSTSWSQGALDITVDFEPRKKRVLISDLAPWFAPTLLDRIASDVCLYFPRTDRQLWTNELLLRKRSSHFEDLFKSGFAETTRIDNEQVVNSTLDPYTFEDSDDEQDKRWTPVIKISKNEEKSATKETSTDGDKQEEEKSKTKESNEALFKTITITDTTWITYYAVLCWIGTRHIEFAPLLSLALYGPESSEKATPTVEHEDLPPPVSPKSVYRLAHFLEITELATLALENFKSQLTPGNVAYELYTDVSSHYPAIRDIALDYASDHWDKVVVSAAHRQVLDNAEKGQIDGLTGILLSSKLGEKRGSK